MKPATKTFKNEKLQEMLKSMINKNYGDVKDEDIQKYEEKLMKIKKKKSKVNMVDPSKVFLNREGLSLVSNLHLVAIFG
jgi:coenzyme F420-reducing hydrogenase beta subunit